MVLELSDNAHFFVLKQELPFWVNLAQKFLFEGPYIYDVQTEKELGESCKLSHVGKIYYC